MLTHLGLSYGRTWYISRKDLDLHACVNQSVEELKQNDHLLRRSVVDWTLEQLTNAKHLYRKIF